jgi:hypothetical protein
MGYALMQNGKGIALDIAGVVANAALPEATLGKVVVGSVLGLTGIGLAVTDNRGPADGVISGTLALTGKEATLMEGGMRGAASAVGKRIGLASLYFSSAYDFGKSVYDYHTCRSGH